MLWEEKNLEQKKKNMNLIKSGECDIIGNILLKNEKKPEIDITIKKYNNHYQKYDINFDLFKNANTEIFAYFLGFFYADGYNNEKYGKIVISLKEEDKCLLETFSKEFFGSRPIKLSTIKCQTNNKNNICSLSVGSKLLSNILSKYGAPQSKTFKIKFPFWLDKSLWKHFIRGYFDGDGSIMKFRNKYSLSIASNIEFNKELKWIINNLTELNFTIRQHGKITTLHKGGNRNTKKFLDWLYENSTLYLQRKYDRYKNLLIERNRVKNLYSYVYYNSKNNRWISRLSSKYNRKWIGQYNTKEEAINAYNSHPLSIHYF